MKKNSLLSGIMAGVLIIGINSCELDNTNKEHIFDFNILHTNALIDTPLDIAVKGDSLLVNQYFGDKFLVWLSLKDGSLIKTCLLYTSDAADEQ